MQPLFALKMIGRAHSDYIVALAIVVASEVEHKALLEATVVVVSLRDLGVVGGYYCLFLTPTYFVRWQTAQWRREELPSSFPGIM